MAEIAAIAKQFVDFYYATFDGNRANLASLYRPQSMLTWEGQQFQGAESIVEKIGSLPFQTVKHNVSTTDAQPSSPSVASLIVTVSGFLQVDDSPNPLPFAQTFQLIPDGGSYWVFNDIFRLNLG